MLVIKQPTFAHEGMSLQITHYDLYAAEEATIAEYGRSIEGTDANETGSAIRYNRFE